MALKLGTILGGSTTAIVGTASAVSVMMAAAVGVMIMRGGEEAAPPVDPAPAPVEQATEAATVSPEAPVTEPAPVPLLPDVPQFDLVRVEADGSAVIAGRSSAEAMVTLRLDGETLDQVPTDRDGSFVALTVLDPSQTPRVLSLEAMFDGGEPVAGRETVIIAPFGAPEQVAARAPDPDPATEIDRPGNEDMSPEPDVAVAEDDIPESDAAVDLPEIAAGEAPTPVTEPAPLSELAQADDMSSDPEPAPVADAADEEPTEPQAPAVLIASEDGVRVLQSAGDAPLAQTEVRLDAISYSTDGDVTLSGRGPAEGGLRVLLNNEPIRLGEVGPDGDWSLDLPEVDPGTYTLSVEQLSAAGDVTSRIDTPFLREDPARIAASPMLVEAGASVITVQPGFTLWGIARENFGDGVLYVSIFEENRDQIRDPDLIFPGQIFSMPDLPRAAETE